MSDKPLISTRDLSVHFPLRGGGLFGPKPVVRAVEGVNIDINKIHRYPILRVGGEGILRFRKNHQRNCDGNHHRKIKNLDKKIRETLSE